MKVFTFGEQIVYDFSAVSLFLEAKCRDFIHLAEVFIKLCFGKHVNC